MSDNKRNSPDPNKLELVETKPNWVVPIDESLFTDNLKRIFRFFVVESPCPGTSTLGKTLTADYHWCKVDYQKNGWLEKRILSILNLKEGSTLCSGRKREDMKSVFQQISMDTDFHINYATNKVAMLQTETFVLSLCKHIRNSFAHFRFALVDDKKDTIIFEDGNVYDTQQFEVKARMVIKIDALIEVIETIEHRTETMISENRKHDELILNLISNNQICSQNDLISKSSMSRAAIQQAIKRLKSENKIKYSKQQRCWQTIAA